MTEKKKLTLTGLLTLGKKPGGQSKAVKSSVLDKPVSRRQALGLLGGSTIATAAAVQAAPATVAGSTKGESRLLLWQEYLKGNFRQMTDEEKQETIELGSSV